jgi:pSer/pThr/pTyr-binding forkhead associated (FHA) protein
MPETLSERTQVFTERTAYGEATTAFSGGAPSPDRTRTMALAPCPVCGTAEVPGETYCVECGFLLHSQVGADTARRPLPKLVDTQGREFALQAGENIVGREGADVLLPDRSVSRRHAKIVVEEGSVWVEDMGSTNGSRVRGSSLSAGKPAALADGTPVQFGSVKLTAIIPPGSIRELLSLPASEKPAETAKPLLAIGGSVSVAKLVRSNGREYVLASARTTFGRKSGNTVAIDDDATVSGAHAEIAYEDGRFYIEDLGSTNGTKVNGRALSPKVPMALSDGDEVTLGRTALRFLAPAA